MRSGRGSEKSRTRPADVLIRNWSLGKPVALDLTVTSPLNAETISKASVAAGSAAYAAERENTLQLNLSAMSWVGSVSPWL